MQEWEHVFFVWPVAIPHIVTKVHALFVQRVGMHENLDKLCVEIVR